MWLAPVQAAVIPVADRHLDYARKLEAELKNEKIRVQVDDRQETVNQKIRQAQLNKIPYMLIIGDKEIDASTVSVRLRSGEQHADMPFDSFKKAISKAIIDKTKELKL